jgi:hypothetical protein
MGVTESWELPESWEFNDQTYRDLPSSWDNRRFGPTLPAAVLELSSSFCLG